MLIITLYSTENCHLCEQALALCQPHVQQGLISVQSIDIVEYDDLLESYGIRIPVLKREDTDKELGWPFDETMLEQFLA